MNHEHQKSIIIILRFHNFLKDHFRKTSELLSKMDALYLKENIQDALTESLTSMVVSCPDDSIEFIGNYLLNYVERKAAITQVDINFELI